MKKLFSILVMSLFFVGVTCVLSLADESAMTNAEFAELLVNSIGIGLPPGTDSLSDAEYFEVVANILASSGMNYLVDKNAGDSITAGDMAEILYAIIGGTDDLTADGKIQFLVDNGYMSPINADSTVSLEYASATLNNPLFADAVVEAYREPEGPPRPRAIGVGAPGVTPEEPASQI